jgi:ribonuclease Z
VRTLFHPALLHPPFGDPGVWVDLLDEGRALLIDLPAIEHVPTRKLLRVAHVVVTHTHMDHFVGFDHLLRVILRREDPLTVTGPEGFLASLRGRIGAYTWNLIEGYPVQLTAQEVAGDVLRREAYSGATRMRPAPLPELPFSGVVHAERAFRIEVAVLDHGIPVLAVALREVEHLAVNRDRLERRGLAAGPWLRTLKAAIRSGGPLDQPMEAQRPDGSTERATTGELAADLVVRGRGQVLAYLTDLAGTESNFDEAVCLANDADLMICEAAFLDADRDLALERKHLTAREAGGLARRAGAKRLAVFHLSPRYEGREAEILEEAQGAFGGPILALPTLPAP